ncbi:transcriptional regulator [Mangrovimicrobium sediminis]|uniref:Transcriptional regulator n=1 Tax=Mangrovimicrobium sediminis TaxID=2562682 RepID=A0A4Z0LZQ7_9GAMM|nr:RNA-binding domain-containing protein [Haliea sp. SAOS-164]TGD72637.1 transcriptional regulator [Haliea sp. SAOS-164]
MGIESQFRQLLSVSSENEVIEFKTAKNDYTFDKLGKYFSALSNEANLMGLNKAWLVFGVNNSQQVVGTNYRPNRKSQESLKQEIADKTTNRITFRQIHDLKLPEGRVILFEIPAAPQGLPVAFSGHYYGRDGESLGPLGIEEIERIRSQSAVTDWSAAIVSDAQFDDLDPQALRVARENFKSKFLDKAEEVSNWDDSTFLNKAKLTIKGKITRTALILLGREEAEHFLSPAEIKIRWVLRDRDGSERDYALFGMPMLLAVDKLFARIRNLKYRYMREGTLFPEEIDQYEPYSIREAVNNCIAHQDYTLAGRINVIENEESLVFTNLGSFVPGDVYRVVMEDAPEEHYRNRFLANAMFNLKMVDTAGGGIRKLFQYQRQRFFPLPDYDLSENRVKVTLTGKVLDMNYARLLATHGEFSLEEIIALDKVQKQQRLSENEAKALKARQLIEGRKPNYYIAKQVAQQVGQKANYTRNKGFDKQYYLDLIRKAIAQHGALSRAEIDELLWNKLPDVMTDKQKKNKVGNLLSELRKGGVIRNEGTHKDSRWVLLNQ